jgi:hypothetical protein
MNRSEINRALSKALAYLACGKPEEARTWFRTLARLLGMGDMLR